MTYLATLTSRPRLTEFQDIGKAGGRYGGHGEDYVSRFYRLARQWRRQTAHLSSLDDKFRHPAFVSIVGMGDKVVPLLLAEAQHSPDWLFGALHQITGEDPIAEHDRGDIDAMIASWIEWGNRRT